MFIYEKTKQKQTPKRTLQKKSPAALPNLNHDRIKMHFENPQATIQGQFATGYRTDLQTALTHATARVAGGESVLRTGGAVKTAGQFLEAAPATITQQALSEAITKVRQTLTAGAAHQQPVQGNHVFNAIDTDISRFIFNLRTCMATAMGSFNLSQFDGAERVSAELARNYLTQLVEMIDREKGVVDAAKNVYSAIRENPALNFRAHVAADTMSENNDITYGIYSRYYFHKCASALLQPQEGLLHFDYKQAVDHDAKLKLALADAPAVNMGAAQKKAVVSAAFARGIILPGGGVVAATIPQLIANYDADNGVNLITMLSNSPAETLHVNRHTLTLHRIREMNLRAHQTARNMIYHAEVAAGAAERTKLLRIKDDVTAKLNDPTVMEPERSMYRSLKNNIDQYLLYTAATDLTQAPIEIPDPETLVAAANTSTIQKAPDIRNMPGLNGAGGPVVTAVQNAMHPAAGGAAPPLYAQGVNAMENMTATFEAFIYGLRSYIAGAHALADPLFNAEHAQQDYNPVSTALS